MSDRPMRIVDLDAIPTDTAMLDDLGEEAITQWFRRAEAGSTTRYLWQCAFVDWFRRRHAGRAKGWYFIAAEKLGKGEGVVLRYAKLWRLYEHFLERRIPSEIEAFASLSPGILNELGKVPEKTRVEAAYFTFKYVAQHGEPTTRAFERALNENGLLPRQRRERREYGSPLNFRGLIYAPVNEDGVILLFGMVARDLGFVVESVQKGYPDCSAKRRIQSGRYVPVNIEFEFTSSKFRVHRHDLLGCDLIVCWENDWPDCPLEVVELKSRIQELDPRVEM